MLLFNIEFIFSVFPVNCNLQDEYTFQLICNPLDICLVTLETKASTLSLWRKLLFSHSVVSKSLQPHGMQHARLPCPSLSPRVCSNSHPLSQWCYLTISSSATLFSFCLQSFPASESFFSNESAVRVRWPKYWSFSFSISSSMNIQDWFPLGWAGLISLQSSSPRDSQEASPAPQFKSISSSALSLLYILSHQYMTTGKTIALTLWTFISKVMSLIFNTLSRFVMFFFSKVQASFNFMAAVNIAMILEPKKIEGCKVILIGE